MNTRHTITNTKSAFTLIEVIVYMAIVGVMVGGLVSFAISITQAGSKARATEEVHANTRVALDIIGQKIRGSTGVNIGSSSFGSDPGVLSLTMADALKNPTIISLDQDNGTLQIQEGVNPPVPITSGSVYVSRLAFTNTTGGANHENVQVEIIVDYNGGAPGTGFIYSQSAHTAVSVRQ